MAANDSSPASVCASIGDRLHTVFDALDEVRVESEAHLLRASRDRRAQRSDIAELGDLLRRTLSEHEGDVDGIGIATTEGYLTDSRYWIEWWRFDRSRHLEFVAHSLNPSRDVFYDYSALDWFTRPLQSKAAAITGPYIDFGGTNTSTITVAVPVSVRGDCVAVAGADIHTAHFESYLTSDAGGSRDPAVRLDDHRGANAQSRTRTSGSRRRTILVNSDNRVITSNSAEYLPGDLVDGTEIDDAWTAFPVDTNTPAGTAWRVLVPAERNF